MSLANRVRRKLRREALARTAGLRGAAKVAVIGCGQIAPEHLAGYHESGAGMVVAVSDIRAGLMAPLLDRFPKMRAFRDYRHMLEVVKPDIVSVCTWPQHHHQIIVDAARHGVKGIMCEKPLALRMDEIEDMQRVCDDARVKLGVGHQYRFHPFFIKAAEVIRQGQLGRVTAIRGNIQDSVANNGPHLVDTIRFLLADAPVQSVRATFDGFGTSFNREWPVEQAARGDVTFGDSLVAHVDFGKLSPSFFKIGVTGAAGSLEVTTEGLWLNGKPAPMQSAEQAWHSCRRNQFLEFVQWVQGRRTSYAASADTAGRSAELVLAMYESGRTGKSVDLPLSSRDDVIRAYFHAAGGHSFRPAATTQPAVAGSGVIRRNPRLAIDGGPRAVPSLPRGGPEFGVEEMTGLAQVMWSRQLNCIGGTQVVALEKEFAAAYGAPKAIASTSGTAAIHVAIAAINPEPGDEIITTPMSDMGTVVPILMANCVPVFADIEPLSGNLTRETIAARITPRTRAVIVVHLFGRPANMGPIQALLREKGIALIEDCAQAHLAECDGRKVGTFGDLGCFSLQQSKQITCGDGGLTLVNREDLIERASLFIDKGRSRKVGRVHLFLGQNYRMTELQGAVARAQFRKCARLIEARRQAASALTQRLAAIDGVIVPPNLPGARPSWWLYNFLIEEASLGIDADQFCAALQVEGVPAMRNYLERPLFEEDVIAKRATYGKSGYPFPAQGYETPKRQDFPGLEEFMRRQLILPWSSRLTPGAVEGIASAVRKVTTSVERVAPRTVPAEAVPVLAD